MRTTSINQTVATRTAICLAIACTASLASAQSAQEINLYSARHYQTDEALYSNFTKATGIKINRFEAGDEQVLEKLRSEGKASKADVILLVDAARLWKAQIEGLFQPLKSKLIEEKIPLAIRAKDDGQGPHWFGISTRARVIVYNKSSVNPDLVRNYEDLAAPALKGKVCTRSGTHPYMLSWIGAISEHNGEAKTQEWAQAVVNNFARKPRGGDTDQIKAVAVGECAVAVTNTYYLVRMMRSTEQADKDMIAKVGIIWPNQTNYGTHFNISGAGLAANSPNKLNAVKFLEYLASDSAQAYLAEGNNEWPAVKTVPINNAQLTSLGSYKADQTSIASIGRAQILAQRIVDKAGWR